MYKVPGGISVLAPIVRLYDRYTGAAAKSYEAWWHRNGIFESAKEARINAPQATEDPALVCSLLLPAAHALWHTQFDRRVVEETAETA